MTSSVEAAYLTGLYLLDPGLVVKPERALRRGRWTCFDIVENKAPETILANARKRFDGGHAEVDAARAAEIVQAIRDSGLLAQYEAEGGAATDDNLGGRAHGGL